MQLFKTAAIAALLIFTDISIVTKAAEQTEKFNMLFKYAEFADSAYKSTDQIKIICNKYNYDFMFSNASSNTAVGYFVAVNEKTNSTLISVRGTSNVDNVLVDIDYNFINDKHAGVALHKGFSQSTSVIYDELLPRLNKTHNINVTGHSLGGAIAVILAMYLDTNGFNVNKVITFGQPKVTNRSGAKRYEHLDITRVVTEKDMVPIVPPFDTSQLLSFKMDIFWHAGIEYVLFPKQYFSTLQGLDSLMRGVDFLYATPSEKNIKAHQMATYLDLVQQKTKASSEIPFNNRDLYITPNKDINASKKANPI